MTLALVTLEDRRAVYALLDRYLDWLPPARLAVVRPERSSTSVVEGGWRPCGRCAATGRVVGEGAAAKPCRKLHSVKHDNGRETVIWPLDHPCRPCLSCDGGYVRVDKDGKDRMLNASKTEFATGAQVRHERRRLVAAQLAKIAALQRQHDGTEDPGDELSRAHEARERLWRTGSFGSLERTLERLATEAPLRHETLRVFVIERQFDPDPGVQVRLDETVDWLAGRVKRPILLPADARHELDVWKFTLQHGKTPAHREARAQRDSEIAELYDVHSWSLRRLASLYALTPEGVRKILAAQASETAAVASGPAA